jgi:glycosyltransferase involved in cell wall biosynthesis
VTAPQVVYVRVEDPEYPRNALLRAALSARMPVRTVLRERSGGVAVRYLRDVLSTWRATSGAAVIVVAEFSLPFVPIAWCIARARRARLVVDGFVGRHETVIGDWAPDAVRSPRSAVARSVDRAAVTLADLTLIDTEVRAEQLRAAYRLSESRVLAVGVGAPSWATCAPERIRRRRGAPLQVLYYGWYIPLHGVPTIIRALAATTADVELTLVGEAAHQGGVSDVRELARRLGVEARCRFVDSAVDTEELARMSTRADVVLGVFGGSVKAAGVVPNKVWQGLAMGRVVVTRQTPALAALSEAVPEGQLVTVPPEAPDALARALDSLARSPRRSFPQTRAVVDEIVDRDVRRFVTAVESLGNRR